MKKIIFSLFSLFFLFSCSSKEDIVLQKPSQPSENSKIILALGDSLTAGYGLPEADSYPSKLQNLLKSKGYNYKVVNSGVSGNTTSDLLDRLNWLLDGEETPEIVLLVIGGNDGLRSLPVENTKQNIEKIIDILQSKNIKVVLGGMQIPPNLGISYARDFKNMYSQIAQDKKVLLIDFFLEGVAGDRSLNQTDMIHPNALGYDIITDNVYQFLLSNKLLSGLQ